MGPRKMLMKFMDQMRIEQLFSEGKYMVVYLEPETILPKENEHFLFHVSKVINGSWWCIFRRCFKLPLILFIRLLYIYFPLRELWEHSTA